jgi:hypothetical protein
LDQTRHEAKTRDHEFEDSKMIKLLSKVCAFYEEGHVIMDCPFVPFHTRASIAKHVELQNVARALIVNHRNKNQELL